MLSTSGLPMPHLPQLPSEHGLIASSAVTCGLQAVSQQMISTNAGHDSQLATPAGQPLSNLSLELLGLVLEQLRHLDHRSLFLLRLVCRHFNSIATPVAYHTIKFNDALLHLRAEHLYPCALEHVARHTRLSSIRWQYVPQRDRIPRLWLPSDILDSGRINLDGTRILIEDLPLGGSQHDLDESYLDATLTGRLVSLKLAISDPPLTTRPDSLKRLIMQSPLLQTLHYQDLGIGTSFSFRGAERMPPIRDLVLKSYDWNHSPDEVARHWDFSLIRSLKLVNMPVSNFLNSVYLPDFARLRTLKVEDYGGHLQDMRPSATRRLHDLVKHHIDALETLDITCHTQMFGIDAIRKHGNTLLVLRFRDHVGFEQDGKPCPTLATGDLASLRERMPYMHSLELDMDEALCDPREFLEVLCSFHSLHTLTLHVQTRIRPTQRVDPNTDPDYDAAMETFNDLIGLRERIRPHLPWRCVTINVGGWRRAMVRRLGYEWKRRNEQGVFAERCFVLDRQVGEMRYEVREEQASESPRCRSPVQL
ncbi:integral membrane protein pth11 [Purpureocillium lavendulum]|uniref:Integral membrane protein pth11 n=1 Tax=Purpureocillium lavendulum TaxID=1247861 RepID=A0AB34FRN4_9HYPO|nr:integral membrane protein pth11 [Purpureocillium lavendulum]